MKLLELPGGVIGPYKLGIWNTAVGYHHADSCCWDGSVGDFSTSHPIRGDTAFWDRMRPDFAAAANHEHMG